MASESKRWPLPLHRLSVSKNVFKRLHKEMNREEKRVGLCWNGWSWFCSPFFFVLLIVLTHFLTESSNGVAFLFLEMVWNVVLRSIFVTSECLDVTSLLKGVIHLSVETARNVFLETSFLFFLGGGFIHSRPDWRFHEWFSERLQLDWTDFIGIFLFQIAFRFAYKTENGVLLVVSESGATCGKVICINNLHTTSGRLLRTTHARTNSSGSVPGHFSFFLSLSLSLSLSLVVDDGTVLGTQLQRWKKV